MSVTSVKKKSSEANEISGSPSTIDEVWVVQCSASPQTDDALVVLASTSLPALNSKYNSTTEGKRLHCKTRKPKYDESSVNPWVWEVSINFSQADPKQDNQSDDNDPTEDVVQVDGGGVEFEQPFYIDAQFGDVVANSAGDTFDPQPTRIYYDEEIIVTRNESPVDPDLYTQYRGSVNADDFTIVYPDGTSRTFDAGTVKMGNIKYQYQVRGDYQFYRVTYPLMKRNVDPNVPGVSPWARTFVDEGYRYLDGTNLKDIKINGKRVSAPLGLDGSGGIISEGVPPETVYFFDYIEMPFTPLGLTN